MARVPTSTGEFSPALFSSIETADMILNRRQFLLLTVGLATGCRSVNEESYSERLVNAGPAADYRADGVYGRYRDLGVFVVRKGDKLLALSAICTHRRCKIKAQADRSFRCPCHGSTFDPEGRVTAGPAKRDLPVFTTSVDEQGNLLVTVPAH
jgi:Rieske Fe-S protein